MENAFAKRLKELLKVMDITPTEFAKRIGLQRQHAIRMTKGINPSFETIVEIMKAFPTMNARWFMLGEMPVFVDEEHQEINDKMSPRTKCAECERKDGIIDAMMRFNKLLQKNYDELKKECDEMKKESKRGKVA